MLGAMETMYQRGKIQEESLEYEMRKHSGELPLVGVNMSSEPTGSPTMMPREVIRSTDDEKQREMTELARFHARHREETGPALEDLMRRAVRNENLFDGLMDAVTVASLGQISGALYRVGGQYRRNV